MHTNIPPIIDHNKYISNFSRKANIFHDYFANQCKILDNGSILPVVAYETNVSVCHINITIKHIVDIINKMNPIKLKAMTKYQLECSNYVLWKLRHLFKLFFRNALTLGSTLMCNQSIRKIIVK